MNKHVFSSEPGEIQLDPFFSYLDLNKRLIGPLCCVCMGNEFRDSTFKYDVIIFQHALAGAVPISIAELAVKNGSANPFLIQNLSMSPSVFACIRSSCKQSLSSLRNETPDKIDQFSENLKRNTTCTSKPTYFPKESIANGSAQVSFTFRRHEETQTIEGDESLSFNGISNDSAISAFVCHLNAKVGGPLSHPVFPVLPHDFPFRSPRTNLPSADSVRFTDPDVIHAVQRFNFIKNDLSLALGMEQLLPEELDCTVCGIAGLRDMKDLVIHNFSPLHITKHMHFVYSRSMDLIRLIKIIDFVEMKIAIQNIITLRSEITDSTSSVDTGVNSAQRRMRLSCPFLSGSIKLSLQDTAQLRVQEVEWQEEYRQYENDLPSLVQYQHRVMLANQLSQPLWLIQRIPLSGQVIRAVLLAGMLLDWDFYAHFPWSPSESVYNCTGRTEEEWLARGHPNTTNGILTLAWGIFALSLYTVTLYGMCDQVLLSQSVYKLMLLNGIMEMIVMFMVSPMAGYYSLVGGVYCSHPISMTIIGSFGVGAWSVCCPVSITLALNRLSEATDYGKWMFKGRRCYVFMIVASSIGIWMTFFTYPVIYNSMADAWVYVPFIDDNYEVEAVTYTGRIQAVINYTTAFSLIITYGYLCLRIHALVNTGTQSRSTATAQLKVFCHCLMVCCSTASTACFYCFLKYADGIEWIIRGAVIAAQLNGFVPCLAALLFNQRIRGRVLGLVPFKVIRESTTMMPSSVAPIESSVMTSVSQITAEQHTSA